MNKSEETIFFAASEISDLEQRALYLKSACGDDLVLRERIERLIEAERNADAFLAEDPLDLQRLAKLASQREAPGMMVGPYKLLQQIGEGGCGVVYMAEQEHPIRRRVALKVIKLGMDTRQVIARFEAERQALAMMEHPNIAKVLDAGATDTGHPYFVMELVRGARITDHCDENKLSTRERLELFIKVVQAVQHAHQKGIIHRDIKPSNILVTMHDGVAVPKVIDFGIAKATEQKLTEKTLFTAFEQFIGTPAYVSPEQAEMSGLDIDTRTDIYSLGVLLYEMLIGRTPFDSKELQQSGLDAMRQMIREKEPAPPSTRLTTLVGEELTTTALRRRTSAPELIYMLRGDLDWIVMKCLEKDRTRRYATANALAVDVEHYLKNEPVLARAPSNVYRVGKFIRRNKLLVSAAAAVVTALALATVVSTWQWQRAERHAAEERRYREQAETATTHANVALTKMEAVHLGRAEGIVQGGERFRALPYWALVLRQSPDAQVAARRLLSTLMERRWPVLVYAPFTHSNPVTSALFNRTGTRIVTASADNTAWVWDAATGARVCGPLQHEGSVEYAELSADDSMVITASRDHTMCVWDALTGMPLNKPLRFGNELKLAKISPAQTHFVVVEARTGVHIGKMPPQENGELFNIDSDADDGEFSSDGRFFVGNSMTGNVMVVDVVDRKVVANLQHPDRVRASTFHPAGTWLATACVDGLVRLWDFRTGEEIRRFSHLAAATTMDFSRDGKYLATGDESGLAQVWDLAKTNVPPKQLHHSSSVRSVGFSPDFTQVITSSWDTTARVWNLATGKQVCEPMVHSYPLFWAQFDPTGRRILTAGRGNFVGVWSLPKPRARQRHNVHGIQNAEFSPDGRNILVTSSRGAEEFDAARLEVVRTFTTNEPPRGLTARYISGGSQIALFGLSGTIQFLDARTGTLARQITVSTNLSRFEISKDGQWLTTLNGGRVEVLDLSATEGEAAPVSLPHPSGVQVLLPGPDGRHVLTIAADGLARVWNISKPPQLLHTLPLASRAITADFSPDGLHIATTDESWRLRVWETLTGKPTGVNVRVIFQTFQSLFSPDGRRLAVRVGDPVWLFDPVTGTRVAPPIEHSGLFGDRRVAFSPDGGTLVTSGRKSLHLWNSENGHRIGDPIDLDSYPLVVAFSPKTNSLFCATTNGVLSIRTVLLHPFTSPNWLPALADALAATRFGDDGETVHLTLMDLWNAQEQMMADKSDDPALKWLRSLFQLPGGGIDRLGARIDPGP